MPVKGLRCFWSEHLQTTWVVFSNSVLVEAGGQLTEPLYSAALMEVAGDCCGITVTEAATRVKHPGLKELLLRLSKEHQDEV